MRFFRTRDPVLVERIAARDWHEIDMTPWLANDLNVALARGDDLALFQWEGGDTYSAHWLLASRGRAALTVGAAMLGMLFDQHMARAVWGMIPVENRKSRWFTRRLGCVSRGVIATAHGEFELFIMGRETWASSAT